MIPDGEYIRVNNHHGGVGRITVKDDAVVAQNGQPYPGLRPMGEFTRESIINHYRLSKQLVINEFYEMP